MLERERGEGVDGGHNLLMRNDNWIIAFIVSQFCLCFSYVHVQLVNIISLKLQQRFKISSSIFIDYASRYFALHWARTAVLQQKFDR